MSSRVVHFEIPANNPEKTGKFYTDLFDWKMQNSGMAEMEYWFFATGDGPGIDGAIMKRMDPKQPWMNYVQVDSIDAAIEKAKKLGGNVALPKTPIPGMGAYAAVTDPEGNIVGLWEVVKQ